MTDAADRYDYVIEVVTHRRAEGGPPKEQILATLLFDSLPPLYEPDALELVKKIRKDVRKLYRFYPDGDVEIRWTRTEIGVNWE